MSLPFTIQQFMDVIEQYNNGVWPMQVVIYLLGLGAVFLATGKTLCSGRLVAVFLAFLWAWMGIAYHLVYFTSINQGAYLFGGAFLLEGILLAVFGGILPSLSFRFRPDLYGITGAIFIFYAVIVYPILGHLAGHSFPRAPILSLPCPSTILTFGLLLWANRKVPWYLLVIPLLWSFLGVSAAIQLGVPEDYGLVVAGVLGTGLILFKNHRLPANAKNKPPEAGKAEGSSSEKQA